MGYLIELKNNLKVGQHVKVLFHGVEYEGQVETFDFKNMRDGCMVLKGVTEFTIDGEESDYHARFIFPVATNANDRNLAVFIPDDTEVEEEAEEEDDEEVEDEIEDEPAPPKKSKGKGKGKGKGKK